MGLLVMLNITTLFFLWRTAEPLKSVEGEEDRPRPEEYMRKRLGLTGEQLEKLEESRERHFGQVAPLERELRKVRNELFMTRTLEPDSARVQLDLERIGTLQKSIDSLTYAHFVEIRSICTPEQVKHLARVMHDMAQRRFGMEPPKHERYYRQRRWKE